jgi:hypothetical protein
MSETRDPPALCGVQEQPTGYRCNRRKGHRGDHGLRFHRRTVLSWSAREEWHGPVMHGVSGPRSALTLCGKEAGTPLTPFTYTPRLVRCQACLAILTPSEKVVPARRRRRAR